MEKRKQAIPSGGLSPVFRLFPIRTVCHAGNQGGFTPRIVLEDKGLEWDVAMPGHRSCDPPYPGLEFTFVGAIAAVCALL